MDVMTRERNEDRPSHSFLETVDPDGTSDPGVVWHRPFLRRLAYPKSKQSAKGADSFFVHNTAGISLPHVFVSFFFLLSDTAWLAARCESVAARRAKWIPCRRSYC